MKASSDQSPARSGQLQHLLLGFMYVVSAAFLLHCQSSTTGQNMLTDGGSDGGLDGGSDRGLTWTPLISRNWMISAGDDRYVCHSIQVPNDLYLTAFRSTIPPGQYRAIVVASNTPRAGDYDCGPSDGLLDVAAHMIYASGMGTGPIAFPSGLAARVKAHEYLTLNLHLFNQSAGSLGGTSTVEAQLGSAVDADHEVEMLFSGTTNINIPSQTTDVAASGGCNASHDFRLIALWPTMNAHGIRQVLTIQDPTTFLVPLDQSYQTEQQIYYLRTIDVRQGDHISTICHYTNPSPVALHFGSRATDEVCFTGIYGYPASALPSSSSRPFGCVGN